MQRPCVCACRPWERADPSLDVSRSVYQRRRSDGREAAPKTSDRKAFDVLPPRAFSDDPDSAIHEEVTPAPAEHVIVMKRVSAFARSELEVVLVRLVRGEHPAARYRGKHGHTAGCRCPSSPPGRNNNRPSCHCDDSPR
jgi:hypothetical protein